MSLQDLNTVDYGQQAVPSFIGFPQETWVSPTNPIWAAESCQSAVAQQWDSLYTVHMMAGRIQRHARLPPGL